MAYHLLAWGGQLGGSTAPHLFCPKYWTLILLCSIQTNVSLLEGCDMTQSEKDLIAFIRESGDPARAMMIAVETICQYLEEKRRLGTLDRQKKTG